MKPDPSRARDLLLIAAFAVLLHAPFLDQPVQGDEATYLEVAEQVFRQPLTPQNFSTVFLGRTVNLSGHPHPPLNAYLLAIPRVLAGGFSEVPFHVFYLLFAVGIGFAAYGLAAHFTPRPLWAALLVTASPIVQVNANTVAGPEPLLLFFLLAGVVAFLRGRHWIAGIALALAALSGLQAIAIPPVLLLHYAIQRRWPAPAAWAALTAPYAALAGWQGLQWSLTGVLPAAELATHMSGSTFGRLSLKGASALALLQHLGVLVTFVPLARRRLWGLGPGLAACVLVRDYAWWERGLLLLFVTLGINALIWLWQARREHPFLAGWCLFYFGFAAAAFFAGAARYLLPLAAPMALLFVLQFQNRPRWLAAALAFNAALGLNLSFAAYEFSRVYAQVEPPPGETFLVNGDWGFRHYMVRRGGRVLETGSVPRPGEWIVASELSLGGNYDSLAEASAVGLRYTDLAVRTPLRLIDRHAHSGFSAVSSGLLPFSFSTGPLDRIAYSRTSSFLEAPGAWTPTQFSGRLVYLPEPGASIRLPLEPGEAKLRFALFARGLGEATFLVRDASGAALFERTVQAEGDLWEPHTLLLPGIREANLSVEAAPGLRVGWGELVLTEGDASPQPVRPPQRPYLNLGDLRARPQLISGWYPVEEGAWRWMGRRAEASLPAPSGVPSNFEMRLYFPPGHMERAGGPVTVFVRIEGRLLAQETYHQPGGYLLSKPAPPDLPVEPVTVRIGMDRALPPGGSDRRELGAVVQGLGFVGR